MPRSGYSRRDPIAIRSGYVSHDNNPVDRRGGPESHSGRINHARMNDLASPDTFTRSFNPQSRGLNNQRDRIFSSTASDLSEIPSRDDLYRSEPSQELERRSRGYNPGHFGERVPSHGSSPQLGGLDHGYRDEGEDWPRDSPLKTDFEHYKRVEKRSAGKAKAYKKDEEEWEKSRGSNNNLPPHLRNEDAFDQRQSKAATGVSRSWQSTAEKRNDHNNDYIGHWPREKRKPHVEAVNWAYGKSAKFEEESQRHTNSRNSRWRDKVQLDLDEYFPKDDS